jgi:hypothetical protein
VRFRLCLLVAVWSVCKAQAPLPAADDYVADAKDEATLQLTLYREFSVEELYKSAQLEAQFEKDIPQMLAAAQRRVSRAEDLLNRQRELVAKKAAKPNTVQPYVDELQKRISVASLAISRARTLTDIIDTARDDRRNAARIGQGTNTTHYRGSGFFSGADREVLERAYLKRFGRPLPVSAEGATSLHRALGFDHKGRIDVALTPDQPEGLWLRSYLETLGIPYYAFRSAVIGSATGAHIHIGPGSTRAAALRTPRAKAAKRNQARLSVPATD